MDCWKPWIVDIQRQDFTFHELYLAKYVLRSWCDINSPEIETNCAVTISSEGNPQIEVWGYPAFFGTESGADLTGRGKPDIVIVRYSGGNCCVEAIVYEAGDNLRKIMDIGSHVLGNFTDLNGDGIDEYVIAPDRMFSQFCVECTVWAPVVYEYKSGSGYFPATFKYKNLLYPYIKEYADILSKFNKANPNVPLLFLDANSGDTPSVEDLEIRQYESKYADYSQAVNALYELAVDYLLAGQPRDAQKILNEYVPPEKVSQYMIAIQEDVVPWIGSGN